MMDGPSDVGEAEAEGLIEADCDSVVNSGGVGETEGLNEAETDVEGEREGEADALTETLGLSDADGLKEEDGEMD